MDRSRGGWPALPVDAWTETRETLHRWVQVVGRVRMALTPPRNHWWHAPLYVNAVGLTTSLMPVGRGGLEIQFDLVDHRLLLDRTDGRRRTIELAPRTVADFHAEVRDRLQELDVDVPLAATPVEVEDATPFADDTHHSSYDADAVHLFWQCLVQAHQVLVASAAGFRGKVSPVHFFWGAFDLAVTRFSGRSAPQHPGGVTNCPDHVMWEAYCAELSSAGFWPGGSPEGSFYAYAYPEPAGFRTAVSLPDGATYDDELGEFLLPWHVARRAPDPAAVASAFLDATQDAAQRLADWPRAGVGGHG